MKKSYYSKKRFVQWIFIFGVYFGWVSGSCCGAEKDEKPGAEPRGEMRVWTSKKTGLRVEAAYERMSGPKVRVRTADGKPLVLAVGSLSPADMKYLRTVVVPEIEIDVKKKEDERPKCRVKTAIAVSTSDRTILTTVSVAVKKKSRFPYDGTMVAEVYLIGDETNTEDHRLVSKRKFPVTFTEENDECSTFSLRDTFRSYVEYNGPNSYGEERGCEYAGYVVVVRDINGDIAAYDTNLSYMDNEFSEKIVRLGNFREFTFFRDNVKRRSVPRPEYYEERID